MSGYEKSSMAEASVCREIEKHNSSLVVENKPWENDYCDNTSDIYKALLESVQQLFEIAATESGVTSYQRFEDMEVFPTDEPEKCGTSSRDNNMKADNPLSLMPKNRAKRQASDDDELTVTGKVVMRRTEDYNTDTNEEMKDAVVEAAKNPNVTDALGLKVKPDSVAVEEVEQKLCGVDLTCTTNRAVCNYTLDAELGVEKPQCQCLSQYDDVSPNNKTFPGEVCADRCTQDFCSYAGTCLRKQVDYSLYCSCNDWHVGDSCSVNMSGVLLGGGIAVGVLAIVFFAIFISFTNKRRESRRESVNVERDTSTPHNTPRPPAIVALPRDPEVRMEQDAPVHYPMPPAPPPRPARRPPPPHPRGPARSSSHRLLTRSDPHNALRDPSSDVWVVSRSIPRPRLSI